jgi:hypothetical protein
MRLRLLPGLAGLALLAFSPTIVAQERAPSPPPSWNVEDTALWADRLRSDSVATQELLAGSLPESLPVLEALLASPDDEIAAHAAVVCEAGGRAVRPLVPSLRELLRADRRSWWSKLYAARALAAARTDDVEVRDLLIENAIESEIPALRAACLDAWFTLDPGSFDRLLEAARTGRFDAAPERLTDSLWRAGTPVAERLVALLPPEGTTDPTPVESSAREALIRHGWKVTALLEDVGRHGLAQEALHRGAIALHEPWLDLDGVEFEAIPETPRTTSMPALTWAWSMGHHGSSFSVLRTVEDEDPATVRVDEIAWRRAADGPDELVSRVHRVPRERALAAARQLAALRHLRSIPKPKKADEDGWHTVMVSTAMEHVSIHATFADGTDLEQTYTGFAKPIDVDERIRAQLAVRVLAELLAEGESTPRDPDAEDLALVARRAVEARGTAIHRSLLELRALIEARTADLPEPERESADRR